MDPIAVIIIIALFACIIVAGVLVYRARGEFGFELPFIKFWMKGRNDKTASISGVQIDDSSARGFKLDDETGQPTKVARSRFTEDIDIRRSNPKE